MTVTAVALRILHRLHIQLSDLKSRHERGPKRIKAAQNAVQSLTQELESAKEHLKRNRMTIDEKDLQLRERENRIADLKAKLNSASSNREYQAFVEQVAADEQANSVLSDEILELLDKQTELQKSIELAKENLEKGKAELASVQKHVDDENSTLESEISRISEELKAEEAKLPADFKADYDRIVGTRHEDGLARLDGECCGNCNQMITPQMHSELIMLKPILCRSCGSFIYLPESGEDN
jgi:predicted  nucleic acid-binding Zn-ribbon protein